MIIIPEFKLTRIQEAAMTRMARTVLVATTLLTTAVVVSTAPARADDTGPNKRWCCGISFGDGQDFARHMIPKHKAKGCLECGVLFESRDAAAVHAVASHEASWCLVCDKKFETPQAVVRHLIEVHGARGCTACGVVFEGPEQAKKHAEKCCAAGHGAEREEKGA